MFSLLSQTPRLVKTIRKEHKWLANLLSKRIFDGIISDNRYGLFHPLIPSVFMTHQLLAQTGLGNAADQLVRRLHYKYISRFNACWIVDVEGAPNLSGKLAHPQMLPPNATYVGLLSQMLTNLNHQEDGTILVLLSGPEPQRSILSSILWKQVQQHKGEIVFVEGTNNAPNPTIIPAHITYHKQITRKDLQPLLSQASLVICRSGYSTLMDLATLQKKAILIPTPGQTEQEYLARHLHHQGIYYATNQKNFNLTQALQNTAAFPFQPLLIPDGHDQYQAVIDNWLEKI